MSPVSNEPGDPRYKYTSKYGFFTRITRFLDVSIFNMIIVPSLFIGVLSSPIHREINHTLIISHS